MILYEYDIFIGEEDYLSKGVGHKVIEIVNREIYKAFNADGIVLRPFKRNIRACNCYRKCGFKEVLEYDDIDRYNNIYVIRLKILDYNSSPSDEPKVQRVVIRENDYNDYVVSFQVVKEAE